ncbi:hypothetical protein C8J57DRAFT_1617230 [Mycena rebaudengoi]|nr:hypothetical protein C8J57DRAFT_1617230 [Mycena rebaudengoi]
MDDKTFKNPTGKFARYWYIDFGNSDLYPEGTEKARTLGLLRNCKEIQELSNTVPYNPFKVDVCQLGIVIRAAARCRDGNGRRFTARGVVEKNPDGTGRSTARPYRVLNGKRVCSTASIFKIHRILHLSQGNLPPYQHFSVWENCSRWTAVTAVFQRAVGVDEKCLTERARHPVDGCRGTVATGTGGSPNRHPRSH